MTRALDMRITGMHCASCANRVSQALRQAFNSYMVSCTVDPVSGFCRLVVSRSVPDPGSIAINAVESLGYSAELLRSADSNVRVFRMRIKGMHCGNCVKGAKSALEANPLIYGAAIDLTSGVATVQVDTSVDFSELWPEIEHTLESRGLRAEFEAFADTEENSVTCDLLFSGKAEPSDISSTSGIAGIVRVSPNQFRVSYYPATIGARQLVDQLAPQLSFIPQDTAMTVTSQFDRSLVIDLLCAAFLTGVISLASLPFSVMFLAASVVVWVVGRRFHRVAWGQLRRGEWRMLTMDCLVSLATNSALLAGVLLPESHDLLHTASVLICIVLLGKTLEDAAKRAASRALFATGADLLPTACDIVKSDGGVERIPIDLLQQGDVVKVLPGSLVPADGEVVDASSGSACIESLLTGESIPISKSKGGQVIAGGVCSGAGFDFIVTRVGSMTTLKRIEALTLAAQSSKAPFQSLVDRVSSFFIPGVVSISLLTLITWLSLGAGFKAALEFSLSVLLVSCPCALGLAAPTAVVVATAIAAKKLACVVKNAAALETLAAAKVFVFDKTGTLTEGKPQVEKFEGFDDPWVWAAAAAVEVGSEHPIACAIRDFAKSRSNGSSFTATDFQVLPASCVSGAVGGKVVKLSGDFNSPWLQKVRQQGGIGIAVFVDDICRLQLSVRDSAKPNAKAALARLRGELWVCTGDHEDTAVHIAEEVGVPRWQVKARYSPQGKKALVEKLRGNTKQAGRSVVMVGDGVNDAPALAAATLGVAIGAGARLAAQTADVILVRGDLGNFADLVDLAKLTVSTIKWNLAFSFTFNLLAIPLAAGAFASLGVSRLPPALAGLAMATSSLLVVSASLLIAYRFKPSPASE